MRLDSAACTHPRPDRHPHRRTARPFAGNRLSAIPTVAGRRPGHPRSDSRLRRRLQLLQPHTRPRSITTPQRTLLRSAAALPDRPRRCTRAVDGPAATAGTNRLVVLATGRPPPTRSSRLGRTTRTTRQRPRSQPGSRLRFDGPVGVSRVRNCLAVSSHCRAEIDSGQLVQCDVRIDRVAGAWRTLAMGPLAIRLAANDLLAGITLATGRPGPDRNPRHRHRPTDPCTGQPTNPAIRNLDLAGSRTGRRNSDPPGHPGPRCTDPFILRQAVDTGFGSSRRAFRSQPGAGRHRRSLCRSVGRMATATTAVENTDGGLAAWPVGQPVAGTVADLAPADGRPRRAAPFADRTLHGTDSLAVASSRAARRAVGRVAQSRVDSPGSTADARANTPATRRRMETGLAANRPTCRVADRNALLVELSRADSQ